MGFRLLPLIFRRPDNLVSVPQEATRFPCKLPAYLRGDPKPWIPQTLSLLESQSSALVPWNPDADMLVLPAPSSPSQLPVELLEQLSPDFPVLIYESEHAVWPNLLVTAKDDVSLEQEARLAFDASSGLGAYRSGMRAQGRSHAEALMLLPARRLLALAQCHSSFERHPKAGQSLQNRRFLATALDHYRSVACLQGLADASSQSEEQRPLSQPGRVAAVMPHFDDESIACGGALAAAVDAGAEVRLIWLTDGSRGISTVSKQESARRRKEEGIAAAAVLGVSDVHFLEAPETQLQARGPWTSRLRKLLRDFEPDRVHTVWWGDNHVDHYEANRVLSAAWPSNLGNTSIAASGVWAPLPHVKKFARLQALSESLQCKKDAALACHESQIQEVDYLRVSRGLDAWNGRFSDGPAEAYLELPAQDYFHAFRQSGASWRWFLN